MNMFYVYHLIDPKNNLPFYVGKGKDDRMFFHENSTLKNHIPNNNKFLFRKIKKVLRESGKIEYLKIKENLLESDALLLEIEEIKKYGRRNNKTGILCNLTDGGDGMSGFNHTESTKKIIKNKIQSIVKTTSWRENYEKGRSLVDWKAVRKKQSITLKNRFKNDVEFMERHRKKTKEALSTDDARKKNSIRISNFYKNNPEQKLKLSKIQKNLWKSGKYDLSKEWDFISPSGEHIKIKNLTKFCRDNNLLQGNMWKVYKGKRTHHRGWRKY